MFPKKNTNKILVVEDNKAVNDSLSKILEFEGFSIYSAENGNEALTIIDNNDIDLILLDISLPDISGFEIAVKLQKEEKFKQIPIIFLTGKSERSEIVKGLTMGAVDYITKPFYEEELLARVKTHIKLKNTQNELKNALYVKDKFFAIISHDLKSPIGNLSNLLKYILKDDMEPEKIKNYLNIINQSASKAYTLLENLLHWSKNQNSSFSFNISKVNISAILNNCLDLYKVDLFDKQIKINNEVSDNIHIQCDADILEVIIRNLISNAIKYTPMSGNIEIHAEINSNNLELSITDSGQGMDAETKNSIFKLSDVKIKLGTKGEKGSGFGLILIREFLEKCHGQLLIDSEIGKGSTFKIIIPEKV